MEDLKYFIVQVKLEMETDLCDKAGNPKVKKWDIGYGYYPGPTVLSLKTLKNHSSETNFNGEWIYDTY